MMLLFPSPPDWLASFSREFIEHVSPWIYWLLAITHFTLWGVLRWQKANPETLAAKWFRRFIFSKSWVWLALAIGRTIAPEWLLIAFGVVTVYVLCTTSAALIALFITYGWPTIQHRRGRGPKPPEKGLL